MYMTMENMTAQEHYISVGTLKRHDYFWETSQQRQRTVKPRRHCNGARGGQASREETLVTTFFPRTKFQKDMAKVASWRTADRNSVNPRETCQFCEHVLATHEMDSDRLWGFTSTL